MSVAACLAETAPGLSVAVVYPGSSTTERSSGVAWWPNKAKHTADMLMEAAGARPSNVAGFVGANESRIGAYVESAAGSFAFWERTLGLSPWPSTANPAWDYTQYTSGGVSGQSFHLPGTYTDCGLPGQVACGAKLVARLAEMAAPTTDVVLDRVASASFSSDGRIRAQLDSGKALFAGVLVVATGGLAVFEGRSPRLASDENDGNLSHSLRADLRLDAPTGLSPAWHLEFEEVGGQQARPRWFGLACGAGGEYDLCRDYSSRAQILSLGFDGSTAANDDTTKGGCSTKSGRFWRRFMLDAYKKALSNANAEDVYASAQGQCGDTTLSAGVIDTKGSFSLTERFASVSDIRVFASGTAAARFTGDAYFAPGATIGLALHTGYVVAQDIPAAIRRSRPRQAAELKSAWAPAMFIAATWILGAGVVAHVFEFGTAHYCLMTLGSAIAVAAVLVAVSSQTRTKQGSGHAHVGHVVIFQIVANSVAGALMVGGVVKKDNTRLRMLHRASGVVVVLLLAGQHFSGASNLGAYHSVTGNWEVAAAVYCVVPAVAIVSFANHLFKTSRAKLSESPLSLRFY